MYTNMIHLHTDTTLAISPLVSITMGLPADPIVTATLTAEGDVVGTAVQGRAHPVYPDLYVFAAYRASEHSTLLIGAIINSERNNYLRVGGMLVHGDVTGGDAQVTQAWTDTDNGWSANYLPQSTHPLTNVEWSDHIAPMQSRLSAHCSVNVNFDGAATNDLITTQGFPHNQQPELFVFAVYDGGYVKMVGATESEGIIDVRAWQSATDPLTDATDPAAVITNAWNNPKYTNISFKNYRISDLSPPC